MAAIALCNTGIIHKIISNLTVLQEKAFGYMHEFYFLILNNVDFCQYLLCYCGRFLASQSFTVSHIWLFGASAEIDMALPVIYDFLIWPSLMARTPSLRRRKNISLQPRCKMHCLD